MFSIKTLIEKPIYSILIVHIYKVNVTNYNKYVTTFFSNTVNNKQQYTKREIHF
jgi:hypothetical protein